MSFDYNLAELKRLTGMNRQTRDMLVEYYNDLPESKRLKILGRAGKRSREHRPLVPAGFVPEFAFSVFLQEINNVWRAENKQAGNSFDLKNAA